MTDLPNPCHSFVIMSTVFKDLAVNLFLKTRRDCNSIHLEIMSQSHSFSVYLLFKIAELQSLK